MRRIHNILSAAVAILFTGAVAQAQHNLGTVRSAELTHEGDVLNIVMDMDLSTIDPDDNTAVTMVPLLFKDANVKELPPVGVYSRGQFYHYAREGRTSTPFSGTYNYYIRQRPDRITYEASVPYEEWMDGAKLRIDTHLSGCCGASVGEVTEGIILATYEEPIPDHIPYTPRFVYVRPDASAVVKERSVSGEAYVVFRSGKSAVEPDYRNNEAELQKIRATIDSVRMDPDITITQITLRGYSSPDGKYATNERLSNERTDAIQAYVSGLYPLPVELYSSESVAENWDGLRALVAASELRNRDKILEIIDDASLDPDKKEARIKSRYARDWRTMTNDMFPLLRRTDYKVSYTVRTYTSTEEILQVMHTKPGNLSLNEFFLVAQELTSGTPEFNEVFATCAAVYPYDPASNINAANAAMTVGDLDSAEAYLAKAGDDASARYARGVLAALRGDFLLAARYFSSADVSGISEARASLELVERIIEREREIAERLAR